MAISGLINSTSVNAIINFLNEKFGDKITASSSSSGNITIKIGDHTIFVNNTLYDGRMDEKMYNSSGQLLYSYNTTYGGYGITVLACSNGFIMLSGNSSDRALYFMTFNADGTIIYGGTPKFSASSYSAGSFITTTWNTAAITTTASSVNANSTALVNMIYSGRFGENTISEKGYFALYNQYPSTYGIITINGNNYISIYCFYLKD